MTGPTIALCMIVRDEADIIERCLRSVAPHINTYVIADTGSTDGTPELIKAVLGDVPGVVLMHEWVDFGHNRTRLLEAAEGVADYLLLLDADMTLEPQSALEPLTADSYMVRYSGALDYRQKLLVRGDRRWWYEGRTHEAIASTPPETTETLRGWQICHHADGTSRATKHERDRALLDRQLQEDADDPRTLFYLAQTLREAGELERAAELYERRLALGGWPEEAYYAGYQAGLLREQLGDWPRALDLLTAAWQQRPQRLEALHAIVEGLRRRDRHHAAHLFAAHGVHKPVPPDDVLFVHPWVYAWGILFELSITAYWVGDFRGSVAACDELLARDDLPDAHREQTLRNRGFALEQLRA